MYTVHWLYIHSNAGLYSVHCETIPHFSTDGYICLTHCNLCTVCNALDVYTNSSRPQNCVEREFDSLNSITCVILCHTVCYWDRWKATGSSWWTRQLSLPVPSSWEDPLLQESHCSRSGRGRGRGEGEGEAGVTPPLPPHLQNHERPRCLSILRYIHNSLALSLTHTLTHSHTHSLTHTHSHTHPHTHYIPHTPHTHSHTVGDGTQSPQLRALHSLPTPETT